MATKYEMIAKKGTKSIVLGYTARRTLRCLAANMWEAQEKIAAELGCDDSVAVTTCAGQAITLSDGTVITFSGRTLLDAKMAA
jgi:hypothetical protein